MAMTEDRAELRRIATVAALLMDQDVDLVLSKCRLRPLVMVRCLVIAYYRKKGYALKTIGGLFERDHATIINALKQHNKWVFAEPQSAYIAAAKGLGVYVLFRDRRVIVEYHVPVPERAESPAPPQRNPMNVFVM